MPGVKLAMPLVEGQIFATGQVGPGTGALVKGIRGDDLGKMELVASNIRQGSIVGFDGSEGVAIGTRMAENLGLSAGRSDHPVLAGWRRHAAGHDAAR